MDHTQIHGHPVPSHQEELHPTTQKGSKIRVQTQAFRNLLDPPPTPIRIQKVFHRSCPRAVFIGLSVGLCVSRDTLRPESFSGLVSRVLWARG